jgi:hypothetical protein
MVPAVLAAKSLLKQTSKWSINQWLLLPVFLTLGLPFPFNYRVLLSDERFARGSRFLIAFAIMLSIRLKWVCKPQLPRETLHEQMLSGNS